SDQTIRLADRAELQSLSLTIPNVQLDPIGSAGGHQNFAIRGLGITGSIPSIDPTVGVFVDGVYQGFGGGVVLDNFDLEGIEVLRGPQGVLFGRNVTGGAILVRTRRPSFDLGGDARFQVESGPQYTIDGSITGPVINDVLAAKFAVYANRDEGYFFNQVTQSKFSPSDTWIARPSLLFTPTSALEVLLRAEFGDRDGKGAVYQNSGVFDRDSFDIGVDEEGESTQRWVSASMEINLDVPFGDGTITNILGWRDYETFDFFDVDGFDQPTFNALFDTDQKQISNELRYSGTFDFVDVTTGVYYFSQDIDYVEGRFLFDNTVVTSGGGDQEQSTFGVFGAADLQVADPLTLNLGVRYTREKKDVNIAQILPGGCNEARTQCNTTFSDDETWSNVSPRAGLQFEPTEDIQFYGYWARGFRSGGYNLRLTSDLNSPGPVDEEKQNSYEIGAKADLFDRRARINVAAFRNRIDGIQREVTTVTTAGPSQRLTNVGDLIIKGFEGELQFAPIDGVVLSAFGGYLDGEFDSIDFDLTGDGVIDGADFALEPPRAAPWTYGFGLNVETEVPGGTLLVANLNFSHRDESFATDNNTSTLDPLDNLDVNVAFRPAWANFQVAFYGRNLLDESYYNGNAAYPDIPVFGGDGPDGPRPVPNGGTQKKGRILGAEI
ncbi:MAG: TonB-dependent receptor, partial [Pseudomonadota bacterium]